jgi:hypothetical protein
MIVGRNPAIRLSAIPFCRELTIGAGSTPSSTQTRLGTKSTGEMRQANLLGMPAAS